MPKVSIICPVLNSIKYINEMMDSILSQTLSEIEIIVVDAGSTDGTVEEIKQYMEKDKRIILLASDKRSVGYQCNLGMDKASGDYIGIVESDDYIAKEMFEKLYNKARENDADIVKAGFDMFFDADDEKRIFLTYSIIPNSQSDLYGKIICPEEHADLIFRDINIWSGIYKRSFIREQNIRSNETEGAAFQDIGFVQQSFMLAKRIVYMRDSFYRYRRDNESSSVYNNKAVTYIMNEFYFLMKFLEEHKDKKEYFGVVIAQRMIGMYFGFYNRLDPMVRKSESMVKLAGVFRDTFREFYETLDQALMSQYNFRQSIGLELLFKSMDKFDDYISERTYVDRKALVEYRDYISRQTCSVIFGCGENGSASYSFLRRNHVNNLICFCDNDKSLWGKTHMGIRVLSPEAAAQKYPDALFIVANDAHFHSMKSQLMEYGVKIGKIYKSISIQPHGAAELV